MEKQYLSLALVICTIINAFVGATSIVPFFYDTACQNSFFTGQASLIAYNGACGQMPWSQMANSVDPSQLDSCCAGSLPLIHPGQKHGAHKCYQSPYIPIMAAMSLQPWHQRDFAPSRTLARTASIVLVCYQTSFKARLAPCPLRLPTPYPSSHLL